MEPKLQRVLSPIWDKEMGKRFGMARKEKGISQERLSRSVGMSQSHFSKFETGKLKTYPQISVRMLRIWFGDRVDFILLGERGA